MSAEIIPFPRPARISVDLDHFADFDDFVEALRRSWRIMHPNEPLPEPLTPSDKDED